MKKLYKGDIIQRSVDSRGNPLDCLWGTDLMGVNKDVDIQDSHVLWYRPVKNHIKHILWKLVFCWYSPLHEKTQKKFKRLMWKMFA